MGVAYPICSADWPQLVTDYLHLVPARITSVGCQMRSIGRKLSYRLLDGLSLGDAERKLMLSWPNIMPRVTLIRYW